MKQIITYSFFYLSIVFLTNLFYDDSYGNFIFLFLISVGVLFNILIIFKSNILRDKYKFLSAGFIGALTCFLIFDGGIVPLLYIKNTNFILASSYIPYLDNKMLLKFASVTAVGNVFFWIGYKHKIGDYIFSFYYLGLGYKRFLNMEINSNFPKFLIVTGFIFNVILFKIGAYGRGLSSAEDFSGFLRYLVTFSNYIEKISLIAYFLIALIYFKTGKEKKWFWATLVIQIFFALVSGARGPIIFIFILTLLPYYYVNSKISRTIVLSGVFAIIFAFTIASEFKYFTQSFNNKQDVTISNYTDSYFEYKESNETELDKRVYSSVYYTILERFSTLSTGAIAIKYADTHGVDKSDPAFLTEILSFPLYVLIPRSKILNKPFPSWGDWFRVKVLGYSTNYISNTSFGTVAFFYFAGGWFFVALGFLVYGVVLRFCTNILHIGSEISFLIYLAIISRVGYIGASIPPTGVSFLRMIIFLPIVFYLFIYILNKIRLR